MDERDDVVSRSDSPLQEIRHHEGCRAVEPHEDVAESPLEEDMRNWKRSVCVAVSTRACLTVRIIALGLVLPGFAIFSYAVGESREEANVARELLSGE